MLTILIHHAVCKTVKNVDLVGNCCLEIHLTCALQAVRGTETVKIGIETSKLTFLV